MDKTRIKKLILFVAITVSLGAAYTYYAFQTKNMPQASIYLLPDVRVPEAGQKVLVFAPHPDDETLGAGGLIAEATRNKAEVKIVLVTDGNKHGKRDIRYTEFRQATRMLGVSESNLVFLGYSDGKLKRQNEAKLYQIFKQQIDSYNPDFVVYPEKGDTHPDHATTGRITERVLADERPGIVSYKYLVHFQFYPAPFSYAPSRFLLPPWRLINADESWEKLMLPSDVEGLKNQAVRVYKSQIKSHVPFDARMMLAPVRKNELFETKN